MYVELTVGSLSADSTTGWGPRLDSSILLLILESEESRTIPTVVLVLSDLVRTGVPVGVNTIPSTLIESGLSLSVLERGLVDAEVSLM
jgi:hypothetical protein